MPSSNTNPKAQPTDPSAAAPACSASSGHTSASVEASAWVRRWSHLVPPGADVLDIACGGGRHLRWFAQRGHPVLGIDRDIRPALQNGSMPQQCVQADLENAPWPLMGTDGPRQFAGVVVTHYLWRPLLPLIVQSVAPGGVLIYETFAVGNETLGKPSRPDFLLQSGELLKACDGLHVVGYEHGFLDAPARLVQRIAAVRPALQSLTAEQVKQHRLSE